MSDNGQFVLVEQEEKEDGNNNQDPDVSDPGYNKDDILIIDNRCSHDIIKVEQSTSDV